MGCVDACSKRPGSSREDQVVPCYTISKYILFSSLLAGAVGTGNEPPRSRTAAAVGAFGLGDRPRTSVDQPYRLAAAGEPDRPHRLASEHPERTSRPLPVAETESAGLRPVADCAPSVHAACPRTRQLTASALRQKPPARSRLVALDVDCVTVSASLRWYSA